MRRAFRPFTLLHRYILACALSLFCGGQLFAGPLAAAGLPVPPAAVVAQFYGWYLKESVRHNPSTHDPNTFSDFVSKTLIHELQRLADSEDDPDNDYFIKAQDYLDDWLTDIKIEQSRWDKTSAVVIVALGATEQTLNRLEVSLIVEQDRWKIRKVRLL